MSRAENLKKRMHTHTPVNVAQPVIASQVSINQHQVVKQHDWLQGVDPALVRNIENEVLTSSTGVSFKNIIGLESVKQALRESVIIPILRPDLFTGIRRPPRGILLYGPPGGGKTAVSKACATECSSTFFAISASSLVSKNFGEGEKTVRALFAVARSRAPSLIFIDEVDSIMSRRSADEHEASRRLKTEFLLQFDGISSGVGAEIEASVTVLSATNLPTQLDEAFIRRMPRRIYISLPDRNLRRELIQTLLKGLSHSLSQNQIHDIVDRTEGYSASDVTAVCSDAALGPVREISTSQLSTVKVSNVRPITFNHFITALEHIRPSVTSEMLKEYDTFGHQT